jgi:tRNA nucleotidyltransferase/poly(A) polymerase
MLAYYPQLSQIVDVLKPCKRRVFLVGGALRDYYLGRRGHDFDFAVDKDAVGLARHLAGRIKGTFVLLDGAHGSARVVKKMQGEIWTFDLTDWRARSIQKDLSLRDFTINALAADIFKCSVPLSILDVKGSQRDLKNGTVRMVSKDVFKDDPLRLLRAFSLQASLGFKIERETRARIKKDAHLITTVAMERVREEIFKVLSSPRAHGTLMEMDQIGLLSCCMPQTAVMAGVPQGGYHHLDVWQHSLETVLQLEKIVNDPSLDRHLKAYLNEPVGGGHARYALLKMAVLLHDSGKPETRRQEGARTTFHGHEHAGERITRLAAKHLKLSVKERFFLEDAVRMHLRPGYLSNFKRPSAKAIFRYLRDAKQEAASLAVLALADQAATRGPLTTASKHKHHAKICHMLIERYFKQKEQKPRERLLTGHDLIKTLKLKPSVLFGKILASVEESAALGKIKTKAEAIDLARGVVKKYLLPCPRVNNPL